MEKNRTAGVKTAARFLSRRRCEPVHSRKKISENHVTRLPFIKSIPCLSARSVTRIPWLSTQGVHLIGKAARRTGIGAVFAVRAGFGGEHHCLARLRSNQLVNAPGDFLVRRARGERLVDIGDVADLRDGGDQQRFVEGHASRFARLHFAYGGRAGPGFAVHRTFRAADVAHPFGEYQFGGVNKFVQIQRKFRQLLFQPGPIHDNTPLQNQSLL